LSDTKYINKLFDQHKLRSTLKFDLVQLINYKK